MAVEYTFYTGTYKGVSIPLAEWPRVETRAQAVLHDYKKKYTVGIPADIADAESMAICALADTLYYFESAENGLIFTSSSIGSVSSSGGGSVDTSAKAQAKELLNSAKLYLNIYRGVGVW